MSGYEIRSRGFSKEGLENYDRIFGKKTAPYEDCAECEGSGLVPNEDSGADIGSNMVKRTCTNCLGEGRVRLPDPESKP